MEQIQRKKFWFELIAWALSYRGFEILGVNRISKSFADHGQTDEKQAPPQKRCYWIVSGQFNC